ncbi:MAG: ABC transporter permease [Actinomycetota bacterium]|nr:ABC transporter permease [Actinomycetota bacterium]MDQ6935696.1 ABC transporter permease [Actinomycetota bacterium]
MLRAAWKSLMGRKLRLLMSTFAIVLGVAFVTGTLMFTDTLNKSFTAIFDNSVGDVVVQPKGLAGNEAGTTTLTVPAAVVRRLAQVPGAARADGNVVDAGVFVIDKHNKLVGGQGAPGLAINITGAPAAHGVRPLQVVQGHNPHGPGEVAMDAATVRRSGYFLGEQVHLVSATKRALLTPTLVGIADFPDGGSLNGASATLWDTRSAQKLFLGGKDAYSSVWVTAARGVSQSQLRSTVARALPRGYVAQTGTQAAKAAASVLLKAISFVTIFLLVFAGIALVVGSFLIINTFSMLVAQRSRELALLRALGASRGQVTRSVLFEAFVIGLVGSTIGLGLGVLLAIGIRALFATFGLDLSGTPLIFAPRTLAAAYGVGLLVTMAAAYLPARRSARIPPVAAMRDDIAMPESSMRRRLLIGLAAVAVGAAVGAVGLAGSVSKPSAWVGAAALVLLLGVVAASPMISRPFLVAARAAYTRVFGSVGRLAAQNSLRNPRRTAATASALMIGLALVTTMSVAGTSAKASIDSAVKKNFLGDLVVGNVIGQGFSPQIAAKAATVPGVASVTRIRFDQGSTSGQQHYLTAVDPIHLGDVVRVSFLQGSMAALGPGTILVSDRAVSRNHYHLGQQVTWKFPSGPMRLRIAGVYRRNPMFSTGYVVGLDTLRKAGFRPEDNFLYLKLQPGADATRVQAVINRQTAKLPTVTVKNQQEFAAEQSKPIDQLVTMIYALLGLALVIAVLGVVNTLGLSVVERTREIGLLRAIGLSRRQLRVMIGLESVVISVLGALLGVAMGLLFGTALMATLRNQGLEVTRVPWANVAAYLLAAAVIGVLAATFPARRAARLDVLRAISTE